ncbi:MAG: hypothetical protein JST12_07845 [Armatimonadetes bacterium]|nr:hypothetical protein [Armatimonadota bacterium]
MPDDEFLELFLSWIDGFASKIVKRLKSKEVTIDFEEFEAGMERVSKRISESGIKSAPDLEKKAKFDEMSKLWAEGLPIEGVTK